MTTGVQFDELITIINAPDALMYLGGQVFWFGKSEKEERRYVLCDAVVLLLLHHKNFIKPSEKIRVNKNRMITILGYIPKEREGINKKHLKTYLEWFVNYSPYKKILMNSVASKYNWTNSGTLKKARNFIKLVQRRYK